MTHRWHKATTSQFGYGKLYDVVLMIIWLMVFSITDIIHLYIYIDKSIEKLHFSLNIVIKLPIEKHFFYFVLEKFKSIPFLYNDPFFPIAGYPSELFYRGCTMWETLYGMVLAYPIVCFIFVPVYFSLGITSVYQYLDLRFKSRLVRCLASGTYIVRQLLNQGVTVFTPCVALNTVIGIPYWASIFGITVVSVIFTLLVSFSFKDVSYALFLKLFSIIHSMLRTFHKLNGSTRMHFLTKILEKKFIHIKYKNSKPWNQYKNRLVGKIIHLLIGISGKIFIPYFWIETLYLFQKYLIFHNNQFEVDTKW